MAKRKFNVDNELFETSSKKNSRDEGKKHSLDSDEEDEVKDKGVLHYDDIEGEEDGIARQEEGTPMTAFNMKEEMEEGHFDKQGHFIWKNEKEIRDNWLDNVEWHKIKNDPNSQYNLTDTPSGLADEDSNNSSENVQFDEINNYKGMLELMRPGETVNKALNRLGGTNKKLSSFERLKMKKAGTLKENPDVTKLTALANENLTALGNMDIYQETYEMISQKIFKKHNPLQSDQDMFGDDFDISKNPSDSNTGAEAKESVSDEIEWEFKWTQDANEIHGPHSSSQMLQWVKDGYFNNGVFVRKHGENSNFYSSSRIDFDLYI